MWKSYACFFKTWCSVLFPKCIKYAFRHGYKAWGLHYYFKDGVCIFRKKKKAFDFQIFCSEIFKYFFWLHLANNSCKAMCCIEYDSWNYSVSLVEEPYLIWIKRYDNNSASPLLQEQESLFLKLGVSSFMGWMEPFGYFHPSQSIFSSMW